jgi:transposase
MSSHLRGINRQEVQLLPPCIEDYVPAEAPVRFIDAYVEGLDLRGLGFARAVAETTGRPPYHPGDLLKLYLYGYLNGIRSSRRLEAEATRNLEVLWLLGTLRPDFKTIADFRKDNRKVFKAVFREFNLLCRKLGLFGAELVAIDGSKFKALNNPQRNLSAQQLRDLIQRIEARIEDYLRQLDEQDQEGPGPSPKGGGGGGGAQMQEKLKELRTSQGRYAAVLADMEARGQNEVSLSDGDARKMRNARQGGFFIGYNVQAAVEANHHLIVAEDVVQSASDRGQLAAMAQRAKDELQAAHLQVVADKGYHEAAQLEQCEQMAVTAYVPAQGQTSGRSSKDGRAVFGKEQFHYDAVADAYQCPGGKHLKRRSVGSCRGKTVIQYANVPACRACALRSQCTASETHRQIRRLPNEAVLERAAERLKQPEAAVMMSKRRQSVEHVFGTLRGWHHDSFLMKGLEKVRAEFSLSALSYNLRRVINIMTVPKLLEALQQSAPEPVR